MAQAHLFVVMGSGETTPTMVTPHQRLFARLGDEADAILLDTPYGFQENADEISAKTLEYFSHNVGAQVEVAELRDVRTAPPVAVEQAQAAVADADWVFVGPGSPTYLVDQLHRTTLPQVLRDRLGRDGTGVTIVSSAAAATAGERTIPVYEIYKAGQPPHWEPGLGLLGAIGLDAVLVPHYDNAEGGTHDTRFCYLGERRLRVMEDELPDGTWVLGVDEHTAMIVDLDDGTVEVQGRGGVTVRRPDRSSIVVPAGERTTVADLADAATASGATAGADLPSTGTPREDGPAPAEPAPDTDVADPGMAPLAEAVADATAAFAAATEDGDATAATAAVLELETTVRAWAADTLTGDGLDRAVASFRGLVTRLGSLAEDGMGDPAAAVSPFVELLLRERTVAREAQDWAAADRIRDGLVDAGVELHDQPDGTTWELTTS